MKEQLLSVSDLKVELDHCLVLNGIDFRAFRGEILAVTGLHGTGKSVICRILTGEIKNWEGKIYYKYDELTASKLRKLQSKLWSIDQSSKFVSTLPVIDDYFAVRRLKGKLLYDRRKLMQKMWEVIEDLELTGVTPMTDTRELSTFQLHLLQIAKAIDFGAEILLLDEITNTYSEREYYQLLKILRQHKEICVIYICNRETPIVREADRILVVKGGKNAGTVYGDSYSRDILLRRMSGAMPINNVQIRKETVGENIRAKVKDMVLPHKKVSFEVHEGEIIGVLDQTNEYWQAMTKFDTEKIGEWVIGGKRLKNYKHAIKEGVGFVTYEYGRNGLFDAFSWEENLQFNALRKASVMGVLNQRMLNYITATFQEDILRSIKIDMEKPDMLKLALYKWIVSGTKVLVLGNPGIGLDLVAKNSFMATIDKIAAQGISIILISTDMQECYNLCDRIFVIEQYRQYELYKHDGYFEKIS